MLDSVLLKIAKNAILEQFNNSYSINKKLLLDKYPFLNEDGATFVTLKHDGHLRGCIGTIVAYRSLYDDVVQNAKAAAFKDPRFNPLYEKELSQINLEVSVLSEPEILEYEDFSDLLTKVEPNVDGLIFKHHRYQGTFLPQVWEQLKSPKEFLEHLSAKAGLSPSAYDEHPLIYRYRVEAIDEEFDKIPLL
ncbi:MAG: AmmeMemoRadiSam system protein A [Sulfurimonas sp.]|uniref:AmmeMemoRadiSam system protein A n=1 Tax=Sulfurimonas sp. TaxID=2022749 RepID=UPI0025F225FA|nr:AmmeMemoRadiSam system protein A [Sulfurimonas sp.]MCK9454292.1 AmmeMemoRadiSam system protein A [Sulfurimonas sp.]